MSDEQAQPMTIERLKSLVGSDVYSAACKEAWLFSPGTGSMDHWQSHYDDWQALQQVMRAVSYHTWMVTDAEVLQFFFDLYRDMPAYKVLFELSITRPYRELSPELKDVYWKFFREMFGSADDAQADPVGYVLWCDFFEDPELVEKAWSSLISGGPSDRLIERLLISSGPIPFSLKRSLYSTLKGEKRWHYFIYRSLLHSEFDVYGQIDNGEARKLLAQLELDLPEGEMENYKRLIAALA